MTPLSTHDFSTDENERGFVPSILIVRVTWKKDIFVHSSDSSDPWEIKKSNWNIIRSMKFEYANANTKNGVIKVEEI